MVASEFYFTNERPWRGPAGSGFHGDGRTQGPARRCSRDRGILRPGVLHRQGRRAAPVRGAVDGARAGRLPWREHPRAVRRRRRRPHRAGDRLRGARGAGHAAAAPGGLGRDLGRGDRRVRHRRPAPGLAAGPGRGDRQGRLRHHRARRGVQHPPARDDRRPRWRRVGAVGHQALHLRRRRGAGPAGRGPDRPRRGRERAAVAIPRPRGHARPHTAGRCQWTSCSPSGSSL